MRYARLCDGDSYTLESWGCGLSYSLTHKPSGCVVFVQGDDASRFDDDLRECEDNFPSNTTEQNCAFLWDQCDYGLLAAQGPDA